MIAPPELQGATVEISIEDARWEEVRLYGLAYRAARETLKHLYLPEDAAISVLGTDDARIAALNTEFRDKAQPTNVLSWPAQDLASRRPGGPPEPPSPDIPGEPLFLGDIAIAYETCAREAEEAQKTLEDHTLHLLVHAVLHLLGYDHIDDADADLMERLEVEILEKLGLPNPY